MQVPAPTAPSFVFGYWRPWKEDSNLIDSYLDYRKDVSLVKYGADTIGKYISQASKEQVAAITDLGDVIGQGMEVLSKQLSFLNRNMDILVEQQKLGNLLLQNISELLRVPDSEKERQLSIELGLKFLVSAQRDPDLYDDALEELLKAESIMKQDYFVLHRIGMIYLFSVKHLDPKKALDYFLRAGKYGSVDSTAAPIRAIAAMNRLGGHLTERETTIENKEQRLVSESIADSYEKAAFSAYILGEFSEAIVNQSKALHYNPAPTNYFFLAKYQARAGVIDACVKSIECAIDDNPALAVAVFKEIDLLNEPRVLRVLAQKNDAINERIDQLIEELKAFDSIRAESAVLQLLESKGRSYEAKVQLYNDLLVEHQSITNDIVKRRRKIDALISDIGSSHFCTLNIDQLDQIVKQLEQAKELPLEKIHGVVQKLKNTIENDKVQIGSRYAGGIVFYIDECESYGVVCAEEDIGEASWGGWGVIGTGGRIGDGRMNTARIVELASWSKRGKLSSTREPFPTAARLCYESEHKGYSDWYLPVPQEFRLMHSNLHEQKLGGFKVGNYWTSLENSSGYVEDGQVVMPGTKKWVRCAYAFDFGSGDSSGHYERGQLALVRAVRAFQLGRENIVAKNTTNESGHESQPVAALGIEPQKHVERKSGRILWPILIILAIAIGVALVLLRESSSITLEDKLMTANAEAAGRAAGELVKRVNAEAEVADQKFDKELDTASSLLNTDEEKELMTQGRIDNISIVSNDDLSLSIYEDENELPDGVINGTTSDSAVIEPPSPSFRRLEIIDGEQLNRLEEQYGYGVNGKRPKWEVRSGHEGNAFVVGGGSGPERETVFGGVLVFRTPKLTYPGQVTFWIKGSFGFPDVSSDGMALEVSGDRNIKEPYGWIQLKASPLSPGIHQVKIDFENGHALRGSDRAYGVDEIEIWELEP